MRAPWLFGVAGFAASAALTALVPIRESDPLTGTLGLLPATLGLLLSARAMCPVPTRSNDRHLGVRIAGLALLVILVLAGDGLGLRFGRALGSAAIITGLAAILFWQAAVCIQRIARSDRRGPREYGAFFLVVFAVYLALIPWQHGNRPPDGDEPYYLLMAHSLAYDLDVDLTNNYEAGDSTAFMPRRIGPQVGDPTGPDGELYSRHNMLLSLVLAPAYRLFGVMGALGLMAALAAAFCLSVLALGDFYFPGRPSACLWSAAILALSPPVLLYSYQVWVEIPAALLTALAIYALHSLETRQSRFQLGLAAAAILLLPLLKLRFLIVSASLVALALLRAPRRTRLLLMRLGVGLLGLTAVALLFNQAVFGQALKHHSWQSVASYLTSPLEYLNAPFGIFFDSAFGLFFTSPIWLLVLPGFWLSANERPRLVADALIVCLPYLLLLGPRAYWYGGWSPPFRYGLVFLPLLPLLMIPVLARRDRQGVRFLLGFLLAATAILTAIWLALPGWTYNFADGRGHLVDHLTMVLDADVARILPSQVRPRTANFVWLAVFLTALPAVVRIRRAATPWTATGGVAALLALIALVPVTATHLPVKVVEFEDPYVLKHRGEPWPDRWTPFRPAYRGSWKLQPEGEVAFDLSPRGHHLLIALDLRRLGSVENSAALELWAGATQLDAVDLPPSRSWSEVELTPLSWPPEERSLRLRLVGHPSARLLLDRARLRWKD